MSPSEAFQYVFEQQFQLLLLMASASLGCALFLATGARGIAGPLGRLARICALPGFVAGALFFAKAFEVKLVAANNAFRVAAGGVPATATDVFLSERIRSYYDFDGLINLPIVSGQTEFVRLVVLFLVTLLASAVLVVCKAVAPPRTREAE